MKISLPEEKKAEIINMLNIFRQNRKCSIREFTIIIGTLIAVKPAVKYGWLHIKDM